VEIIFLLSFFLVLICLALSGGFTCESIRQLVGLLGGGIGPTQRKLFFIVYKYPKV
jgi:hypothetical protein